MVSLSVLDLAPILEGATAADSFRNSLDLARHAESWGYRRFWLAEHHNIPSVASSATSVLIGHIAGGTRTIRVGAGGVMLPNHAPLVIAEQFGTLESLYPGRIDLGLGRAPGGDRATAYALRRTLASDAENFEEDVRELQGYFQGKGPVRAVPGAGLNVPLWLLGSSDFSARLAARLGLPFSFASHFAPQYLHPALRLYRTGYQPSPQWPRPHFMLAANLCAAETDEEAEHLFTSHQQAVLNIVRGRRGPLGPPVSRLDWSPGERRAVEEWLQFSAVGSPETVRARLRQFVQETGADEIIVTSQLYEHSARLRSLQIGAEVASELRV